MKKHACARSITIPITILKKQQKINYILLTYKYIYTTSQGSTSMEKKVMIRINFRFYLYNKIKI